MRNSDAEAKRQVEMQEDWEHASNLVQAARSKAFFAKGLTTVPTSAPDVSDEAVSATALSMLMGDLTTKVLQLGGPNLIAQGWSCNLVPPSR